MKKYLLILLAIAIIKVLAQDRDNRLIYGCYQLVGENTYYIINESNIIRLGFCDICDEELVIYSTSYSYNNDTLTFNFGKDEDSDMNFENIWIRYDTMRFLDYEIGEFVKINKKAINRKLESTGLNSIKIMDVVD